MRRIDRTYRSTDDTFSSYIFTRSSVFPPQKRSDRFCLRTRTWTTFGLRNRVADLRSSGAWGLRNKEIQRRHQWKFPCSRFAGAIPIHFVFSPPLIICYYRCRTHTIDRSVFFFSLIRFFRINLFMILMVVYGRYLLETCVPAHAFVV